MFPYLPILITRSALRFLATCSRALLLSCACARCVTAAPGDPDPTFGQAGVALAPVFPWETPLSMQGVTLLPDGKILVAGQSTAYDDLAVARFAADGAHGQTIVLQWETVGADTAIAPAM